MQSSLRRIARAVKFKIFLSLGHNIIAEVHVSFSFSFSLSLSLSLSVSRKNFPEDTEIQKKTPSLSLFLLAQTVSLNHILNHIESLIMLCIVIIAISAGSRVLARVFSAPEKRAFRARNLFFFVSLSREMFGSTQLSCGVIWFLCNHKHIQSFVNSVLIIAKTLSLSPSLARAFSIEASAKEREKERKRKRDIQY